jgi:hypothetical protein
MTFGPARGGHQKRGATVTRPMAAIGLTAAVVLSGSLVVSGGQAGSPSLNRPESDEDEQRAAERLTIRVCADCHSLAVMTAERRTPAAWLDIVEEMGTRSDATPAELVSIRAFLTRTRGLVAVNTAPAADFVAVLGLSDDVAEAVVAYRTRHGRLSDRDALLNVPAVDKSSLGRDADALWFD